jgi:hydrogenase maturation protease
MTPTMLIAGVGNIFFGDDGFGPEVARRLAAAPLPDWVRVTDYGIRGLHLAYDLLEGRYDTVVLIDAAPRGGRPGTVYLIEPDPEELEAEAVPDPHGMHPGTVLAMLRRLGGSPGRLLVVGCEPEARPHRERMGLSPAAAAAVEGALQLVRGLIERAERALPPAQAAGGA